MTDLATRVAALTAANERRHDDANRAVHAAVDQLLRKGQRVNVNAAAKAAGVSRTFIYSQPDVLERIRIAGRESSHSLVRPGKPSSERSLRARLEGALNALDAAKKENTELRGRVERLTAELVQRGAR